MTDWGTPVIDPGRHVGPSEPRDPITGELRSVAEKRRANDPFRIAEQEGWEKSMFLGLPRLTKDGRVILDITSTSGYIFSDEVEDVLVLSWMPQVRAALRGTRCTCRHKATDGGSRPSHESFCPLAEVA